MDCIVSEHQNSQLDDDLHSSHVPEDEHESKLFVKHVPSLRNHVLCLGTSVDVQTSTREEDDHVAGDSTHVLVLLDGTGKGDEEKQYPRYPDFGEHLEVDDTDSRVERSAHEYVVEPDTGHSKWFTSIVECSS